MDTDGDGVDNNNDHCPLVPSIVAVNMSSHTVIYLDPTLSAKSPVWEIKDDGREVRQLAVTEMPLMLIGLLHL